MLNDVVKELSARDVFHDHEDVGGCADDLVQFDDVRVSEKFEILNLTPDLAHNVQVFYLLSVQDLDSHFVACQLVLSN